MRSTAHPSGRLLVSLVLLVALASGASASGHDDPDTVSVTRSHHPIVIAGGVRGLFPGASKLMTVTVWNLDARDLRITSLVARPGSGRSGCPTSVLRTWPLRSHPAVPGEGSIRVHLRVHLLPQAPDACQGVRFPITFRITAVQP